METCLTPDHPLHDRFARLTAQEEKHGLLDDSATIGTGDGCASQDFDRSRLASRPA
jgi:hypothetical protein